MLRSASPTNPEFVATNPDLDGEVLASAVRRIIGNGTAASHPGPIPKVDEVVADIEVDGISYVLMRVMRASRAAEVSLSPREREIVRLVAKGLPNKAIAAVLDVSLWTVATHLRRVFAKLGVNTRAEIVAIAVTHGLIERPD